MYQTVYCDDAPRREWALGHEHFCDGNSEKCGHLILIGRQAYCGYCPARCGLHQIIRSQAGCLFCKHSTKRLDCAKCAECLSAANRINYEREGADEAQM